MCTRFVSGGLKGGMVAYAAAGHVFLARGEVPVNELPAVPTPSGSSFICDNLR